MSKVIYEPHPVDPARKAKLQAQGFKILDATFAPAGTPVHQPIDEVVEEAAQEEVIEEVIVDAPAKRTRSKKD